MERKRIALMLPARAPHIEQMLRGVADYAQRHVRWSFSSAPESFDGFELLRGWRGEGIIALAATAAAEGRVLRLGVPAVNLSGALVRPRLPRVTVDNVALGRLAAEHLLSRGLRQFAYYGLGDCWYSDERLRGFTERLRKDGYSCTFLTESRSKAGLWRSNVGKLEAWLLRLSKPVGIFAVSDPRARLVLDACAQLKLAVPQEAAVLGVDNDEIVCDSCFPALSSLDRNAYTASWEAAALLDRLLAGHAAPCGGVLVPPGSVVKRASTGAYTLEHSALQRAVAHAQQLAAQGCDVKELVAVSGMSRRSLEVLFRETLRCTPHEFIRRVRVERARELLAQQPEHALKTLARASGFGSIRQMRQAFLAEGEVLD